MNVKALIPIGILGLLFVARKANAATAERLIRETEGLSLEPYMDEGGTWHVGYGHALPSKPNFERITQQQADQLLQKDIGKAKETVRDLTQVPITAKEQAALTSFVFNLGKGALDNSTLLKKINAGNKKEAAEEFSRWIYVKGSPSKALRTRREAEKRVFLG